MRQTSAIRLNTDLRRGDAMPTGGRFVGTTPHGTTWVWYSEGRLRVDYVNGDVALVDGTDTFAEMCARFDRFFSPKPASRLSAVA